MLDSYRQVRQPLWQWLGSYYLINCLLVWLLGFKYLSVLLPIDLPLAHPLAYVIVALFIALSYLSQLALLLAFGVLLPGFLCSLLLPKKGVVVSLTVILASIFCFTLLVDSHVYALYRFHLNPIILRMVIRGINQIFGFSTVEWIWMSGALFGLILLQMALARIMWLFFIVTKRRLPFKRAAIFLVGALFYSYMMYLLSVNANINELSQQTKILPFYEPILAALLPIENSREVIENLGRGRFTQPKQVIAPLNYPQQPVVCQPPKKPLNVLFIVVDTWRYTTLNKKIMPYLTAFAAQTDQFTAHRSGGNSSKAGMFSLFYGLSGNYWDSFLAANRGPLLFDKLLARGYRAGIFSAADLDFPEFDKTLFAKIPNLQVTPQHENPTRRDQDVTQGFNQFIGADSKSPFFSVLLYEAAHFFCQTQRFPQPFQPAIKQCLRIAFTNETPREPYLNRYLNAVHFIDTQIQAVLQTLKAKNLLQNTVVVITGDHGEEFNDNRTNQWEHASNFTDWQVKTPMLIYWPGKQPAVYTHDTNHYDVVPTLMQRVLNCKTTPQAYSLGRSLYETKPRDHLIVGSYINMGIIEPERITNLYPTGYLQITDRQGRPQPHAKPNVGVLEKAFQAMRVFYRR